MLQPEEMKKKLETFAGLQNDKNNYAAELFKLTAVEEYESLPSILDTFIQRKQQGLINDQNLSLIIKYLTLKAKHDNKDALIYQVFTKNCLEVLHSNYNELVGIKDPTQFILAFNAINNDISREQKNGRKLEKGLISFRQEREILENKIEKFLDESLEGQVPSQQFYRGNLTDRFLEDEERVAVAKYISDSASDLPIFLVERSRVKEKLPLTLDELNQVFCVVRDNYVDRIPTGTIYLRVTANNGIGKVHFTHNDRVLAEEDIYNLAAENLDLRKVNLKFNLVDIDLLDEKEYGPDIILFKKYSLKKYSLIEQLFIQSYLSEIPSVFFEENCALLVELDARYFTENFFISLRDYERDINTPAINKQLYLRAKLDPRYFTNEAMFTYFLRLTKNNPITDDIAALNSVADVLFNKLSQHDNIVKILKKLPEKYFDNKEFTPEIFSLIREEWLGHFFSTQLLIEKSESITQRDFKEGRIMAQAKDIESFASDLEALKTFEECDGAYGVAFWEQIELHLEENPGHEKLLKAVSDIFVVSDDSALTIKEHLEKDNDQLCLQLYHYATKRRDEHFPKEIYNLLRERTKGILLSTPNQLLSLSMFHKEVDPLVENFTLELDKVQRKYQILRGKAGTWGISPERLTAYNALRAALVNKESAFADLLSAIKSQEKNIGLGKSHLRKGLHTFVQAFLDASLAVKAADVISGIISECVTVDDKSLMKEVLLDDLFVALLTPRCRITLAEKFPDVYFGIMEAFRPDVLNNNLDNEQELTSLYNKYKNPQASPQTVTLESVALEGQLSGVPEKGAPLVLTPEGGQNSLPVPQQLSVDTPTLKKPGSLNFKFNHLALLAGVVTKPQTSPSVQDQARKTYQAIDTDLSVGLHILRQEEVKARGEEANIQSYHKAKKLFLPIGDLTENAKIEDASSLDLLEIAACKVYKGRICCGIMSVHGNHFVTVFAYKSDKEEGEMQLMIVDSAYNGEETVKAMEALKEAVRPGRGVAAEVAGGGQGAVRGRFRSGDRLGQWRAPSWLLGIVGRVRLGGNVGVGAEDLAPAAAEVDHRGRVVVGDLERGAPQLPQLGEGVGAEHGPHGAGDRGDLGAGEDPGVGASEQQRGGTRGIVACHRRGMLRVVGVRIGEDQVGGGGA